MSIPSAALDHDILGYQLDGGALVSLYDKRCGGSVATPDVTIGPFPTDHTLLVYLEDRGLDAWRGDLIRVHPVAEPAPNARIQTFFPVRLFGSAPS